MKVACSTFPSYPTNRRKGQRHPLYAFVEAGRKRIDGKDTDTYNKNAGGAKEED